MRRNQMAIRAANVVLSLLVVGMFMYLLVLAMAQDQVLEKLSRESGFTNYRASLLDARKAKDTAELIDELAGQRQKLREEVARAESRAAMAELLYEREAGRLRPVFAVLGGARGCGITREPVEAVDGVSEQEAEMRVARVDLAAARECFDLDDKLGGNQRPRYLAALATAKRLSDASVKADMERKVAVQQHGMLQQEINRHAADLKRLPPVRVHFTTLDPLEFPWLPKFVNLPPFIVHVLLSFFAGTFGALLITMVFVVYPSKLRERVSARIYQKRVFLGGLVALTVFIVLTGGASIVGTDEASDTGTNVMSFTAIGLLAGMFSDTVADWLSARAKKMFSSDDDDDPKDGQGDQAKDRGDRPGKAEAGARP